MLAIESVPKTYEEAIATLAEWQGGGEAAIEIFSFEDPDHLEVRLLEASGEFPATGKVDAFQMGSSDEYPFRSATALVHPSEMPAIRAGTIPLPRGWDWATSRQVWPPGR